MDDKVTDKEQREDQEAEKDQNENQKEDLPKEEESPIKRSFLINNGNKLNYEQQFSVKKSSGGQVLASGNKLTFILIILLLLLVFGGAFFFRNKIKNLVVSNFPTPTPTPIATAQPTPTPNPLVRSQWSFEVLNGSGESGLAKKIATKIQDLGYQVVKTGNADKSNYSQTQILAKQDVLDKLDLVIADLRDVIKIASIAGQLQEGTASARIIIGKDSI